MVTYLLYDTISVKCFYYYILLLPKLFILSVEMIQYIAPRVSPFIFADGPYSCQNNCGNSFDTCSCDSSCHYKGNCCPGFYGKTLSGIAIVLIVKHGHIFCLLSCCLICSYLCQFIKSIAQCQQ